MTDNLSLVQLKYAIAVDTFRNFSQAAENCHVTQPTLSIQLKKLETSLGVVLFDRSKNPVIPTAAGKIFIERARQVLREMEQLIEEINMMRDDIKGEITLGVIPTLAPYLVPAFIGEFAQQYPGIRIKVVELLTHTILEELVKDRLDAGLIVSPVHHPGIKLTSLFFEEIMVYCNQNHPFLNREELEGSDLKSEDLWILGDGHCFRDQVLNLCTLQQPQPVRNIKYESGSLETLKRLVDIEGGFTLIPELSLSSMSKAAVNRTRRLRRPRPLREVSLATARTFSKRKLIEILAAFIAESVPRSMLDSTRGRVVEWQS